MITIPKQAFDEFYKRSIIRWLSNRTEIDWRGNGMNKYLVTASQPANSTDPTKPPNLDKTFKDYNGIISIRCANVEFEEVKGGGDGKFGQSTDTGIVTYYNGFTLDTEIDFVLITPNKMSNDLGHSNNGERKMEMLKGLIKEILSKNKYIPIYDFRDSNIPETDLKIEWRYGVDEIAYTNLNMPANLYQESFFRVPVWCDVIELDTGEVATVDFEFQNDKENEA